ncbi:MAG TPA: FGGY-family carbohydrate kinase, partial [Herpetosiphonaceae bacterium]
DPEYYWKSLCEVCAQLWEQPGVDRSALAGVTLTTQRATMINLDKGGQPLRPAIVWLDQRRASGMAPVGGAWGMALRLAGMRETVAYTQSQAESNWLRMEQPELWAKTDKFIMLSGYLTYRLCGRIADSVGAQVGYLPFDFKHGRWAAASDWKWPAFGIAPEQLPELVPATGKLGEISAEAAAATGIPAGLPLIAAAADKACETLGAGCVEPDAACISYGTSATITVSSRRYHEVVRFIPPYPAAEPGAYNLEVQLYRGFWMVNWFKQQFGQLEAAAAKERGVAPEVLFDELIADIPPGSMGLLLQPFWSPGVKVPGPEAKGAIIGFGDVHTRGHVYRAILEGLAYALREGMERIQRRSGTAITTLRVAGGGSQSDAAMQITADIFGLPAARPHTYEASGLGAAIDAAVGLGFYPDVPAAARAMTRPGKVFEPRPEPARLYDGLYRDVYHRMYPRLKPLYDAIRRITGYPA